MISLFPILLYLPTFINAHLYAKTSNLSMDIWNLLEFSKTAGKFKTLIECGSVCEATENCNAFKFDKTTAFCALAKVQLLEVILKNFFSCWLILNFFWDCYFTGDPTKHPISDISHQSRWHQNFVTGLQWKWRLLHWRQSMWSISWTLQNR